MEHDYTFYLPATAEDVEGGIQQVAHYCTAIGFNEQACFAIQIAMAEALNNIIEHALSEHPQEHIKVHCHLQQSTLVIELFDNGKALNKLPDGALPDWQAESGRGWPIIFSIMDEVHHRYHNQQNHLTLKKQLPDI